LKKSVAAPRRKPSKPRQQNALRPVDWVATAADLLAEHNVHGVKIPDLCIRIGASKGSFYWHFNSRSELLSAILEDWRKRMTADVSARASRLDGSVDSVLRYLLGLIRKPRPNRNAAIERSVRDWARTDQMARTAVADADQARLAFFQGLFRKQNFTEEEARLRAYAAYAFMMGDSILKETVDLGYPPGDYVKLIVELLLAKPRPTEAA
jgi:AcrR family transcriptional regulator